MRPRIPTPTDLGRGALIALCVASLLACGGKKEPEPLQPQTSSDVAPQLEPPPPLPPPVRAVRPTPVNTVKVIDPGGSDDEPRTLIEASRLAKAQKEEEEREPIAEINDDNLHEYAEGGEIIVLEGEPAAPPLQPPPPASAPAEQSSGDVRDESYWRNGALDLRMGWRRAVDEISELELQSAALRQQFYAEEDLSIRDNQIKPSWDRVLDRLLQLRENAGRFEQQLDTFIEEGRQAGVPQGWLAEGWELEPTTEEKERVERFSTHHVMEPPNGLEDQPQ